MAQDMINNEIYHSLNDRWYEASDHPIALLRCESKFNGDWIISQLAETEPEENKVLDIGCGGGFLCNRLGDMGFQVTGVDLSRDAIEVAKKHDVSGKVKYSIADATQLPFFRASFDVVTCLDLLEHVESPDAVIAEISRVLKPGGFLFFHTLNRNWLSYLIAIKGVEWFVRNTPERLHLYRLFIKPAELQRFCRAHGLIVKKWTGLRPRLNPSFWRMLKTGVVDDGFSFQASRSLALSYLGMAVKPG